MRTEEEREAMIRDITGNDIEAGSFIDQFDELVEDNERLEKELKVAKEEIARIKRGG